jgi:hypothetical protein
MKPIWLLLGFWLASGACLVAQVRVEVTTDQEHFLPGERLVLRVKIINQSSETLELGKEPDWLKFGVEGSSGFVVNKLGEVPVTGEFSLASSEVAVKQVDVAPFFDVSKPGRYKITASLKLPQWNLTVVSPAKSFDVINGTVLWQQDFGVPGSMTASRKSPEIRQYTLQKATYLKQLQLYVRVSDTSDNRVCRVFSLAPMVSFSHPEAQIDRESRLHVFSQTGARSFVYAIVNPEGELLLRQVYDYSTSRPKLATGDDGKVVVRGGTRRVSAQDLPEAEKSVVDSKETPAKP